MTGPATPDLVVRRRVPEMLDGLDATDPRAAAARRDLARVNALMLQAGIMARLLRRHVPEPPRRVLEIGAGDGAFMLAVARRLTPGWRGIRLLLLDQRDLVSDAQRRAFADLGWRVDAVTLDVFEWLAEANRARFGVVTANLFLHHFGDEDLARMMSAVARISPAFIATEPRRERLALAASRMLWAIGANEVTRHDAPASVCAGFAGRELSRLWPDDQPCRIEEGRAGLFTHAFAVSRVAGAAPDEPVCRHV